MFSPFTAPAPSRHDIQDLFVARQHSGPCWAVPHRPHPYQDQQSRSRPQPTPLRQASFKTSLGCMQAHWWSSPASMVALAPPSTARRFNCISSFGQLKSPPLTSIQTLHFNRAGSHILHSLSVYIYTWDPTASTAPPRLLLPPCERQG